MPRGRRCDRAGGVADLQLRAELAAGSELAFELFEQAGTGASELGDDVPVGAPPRRRKLTLCDRRLDGVDENDPPVQPIRKLCRERGRSARLR